MYGSVIEQLAHEVVNVACPNDSRSPTQPFLFFSASAQQLFQAAVMFRRAAASITLRSGGKSSSNLLLHQSRFRVFLLYVGKCTVNRTSTSLAGMVVYIKDAQVQSSNERNGCARYGNEVVVFAVLTRAFLIIVDLLGVGVFVPPLSLLLISGHPGAEGKHRPTTAGA